MPILPREQIDLWLTCCASADRDILERYRTLLSDSERDGERRFRYDRDRRRYVVTRALVRTVLSKYSETPPAAWRFRTNRFGRPEIDTPGKIEQSLSFNVSHTSDVILLGVTLCGPIGVDIEAIERADVPLSAAEYFFSKREALALSGLPPDLQRDRFLEHWTLKESYIKALGLGLSMPLDSFGFDLADRTIRFWGPLSGVEPRKGWRFWQICPLPGHVAAVCVHNSREIEPILSLQRILPLFDEAAQDWSVLRQSQDSQTAV